MSCNHFRAGLSVGHRHFVADLLSHYAAERNSVRSLHAFFVKGGDGFVQECDEQGFRAGFVDVKFEGVADIGGKIFSVACIDKIFT